MISPAASGLEPENSPGVDRWRQSWLVVLAVTFVLLIVVAVGQIPADSAPVGNSAAAGAPSSRAEPVASERAPVESVPPSAPQTSEPAAEEPVSVPSRTRATPTRALSNPASPGPVGSAQRGPAPVLESGPARTPAAGVFPADGVSQLPGAVPARGSGQFEYVHRRGAVAGGRGPVRRYHVAVETGSNEDVVAFAAQVEAVLSDGRSWVGSGRERLQLVGGSEHADFAVLLATRETAARMCARGGTNIRIGGVPYTSCRAPGQAIINLDRWRGSAGTYLRAGVGLATYRQYVINHEVGHELGHRHVGCPRAGGPAPVMVQQTITLRGCQPNAWPRRDNREFSGPRL